MEGGLTVRPKDAIVDITDRLASVDAKGQLSALSVCLPLGEVNLKLVESLASLKLDRVLREIVSIDFMEVIVRLIDDIVQPQICVCLILVNFCKCQVSSLSAFHTMEK